MRLKDRVALVTGSSHGIGRGIALAYAREGAGEPADIAGAAVYLASDDAKYLTGTCILVDGGMLIPPLTDI